MNSHSGLWKAGFLALIISCSGVACQRNPDNVQAAREDTSKTDKNALTVADKNFLSNAESGDNREIDIGQLALKKSRNPDVLNYAGLLINDHTNDLNTVTELLKEFPDAQTTTPKPVDEELGALQGLSGSAFDVKFVTFMVEDHQKALQKYQDQAASSTNDDIRNYASSVVPVLQKHLDQAGELESKLVNGKE